jgi:outer membrane receptor protein involved in Fe transport
MKLRTLSTQLATACFAVTSAAAALAAEAPAANLVAQASAAGASPTRFVSSEAVEEIVVTAQKRSERMLEVPLSVSVLDTNELASTGNVQLKDYFSQVPGFSIAARGSGRMALILRGIATESAGNPTVGVTIDNAPFGSSVSTAPTVPDIDPFDLDHIEVLRGPQGTLYGASSIGGLVKFVTVRPDTQQFSSRAELTSSSLSHGGVGYGARAAANMPVSDDFALRISGFHRYDAGYIVNVVGQTSEEESNDLKVSGGRIGALWSISDAVTLQTSAFLQDSAGGSTSDVDVDFNYVPVYGDYRHQRAPGSDGHDGSLRFYDATLKADLGWGNFESTSAFGQYRLRGPQDATGTFSGLINAIFGIPGAGAAVDNKSDFDQFSQEFRLLSPDDGRAFQWLYGLFYQDSDQELFQRIRVIDPNTGAALGAPALFTGNTPSTYKEYAGFANIDYYFTPRFDVQVGGRVFKNEQDFQSVRSGPLAGATTFAAGDSSETSFTYQVTPRFKISNTMNVYARVASGYRPGGANATLGGAVIPSKYDSDTTVNYELGLKGEFFDQSLTLESALYYIDWKDIQILKIDQSTGSSYFDNGGTARSQGAEVSARWTSAAGLLVRGSLSYNDAELTEDLDSGTGFKGDRLPFSSEKSGSVTVQQSFPVFGQVSGFVGATGTYVGERQAAFGRTPTTPRFVLPGYGTVDLSTGLRGEDWGVTLYARNVADKMGFVNAQARNATTGISAYGVSLIQPRTIGLSLDKSW